MLCSEARNNRITAFNMNFPDPNTGIVKFAFEGIRRLYAAACARATIGSRPKRAACCCSDLRGNNLRDFELEDFLSKALQLEELCAAVHVHARWCRRVIGGA